MLCPNCHTGMLRRSVAFHILRSRTLWWCEACAASHITSPITFGDVEWEQDRRIAATRAAFLRHFAARQART